MRVDFSASMMCADYKNLEKEIKNLEAAGITSFHIDIMDGQFVPNFAMGLQDLKVICELATVPVEVHLMICHPDRYIHLFANTGVSTIYIHPEADYNPTTTIQKIIAAGVTPGIAINPGTSVENVYELLHIVDKALIMAVNPGHAGQVYLPYMGRKIAKLLSIKDECNVKLYWDGACGVDKIRTYAPLGIEGFVLGTKTLFGHEESYAEILQKLNCSLEELTE